ncbi:hypothetical protein GE21DRAFT_1281559 [Neurospora crassa]|nr:hypothetical protein GE21DRAFT_1281559 [Neurospora crassa]
MSGFDSLCSSPFPKWPEQHVLFSVALLGLNARATTLSAFSEPSAPASVTASTAYSCSCHPVA